MNNNSKTTLGISIGGRYFGYAVMKLGDLDDWGNKTFKGAWTDQKLLIMIWAIEKIIDRYDITTINVKTPPFMDRYSSLKKLSDGIKDLASEKNISMKIYTLQDLHKNSKEEVKHTKRNILIQIALKYPYVNHEFLDNNQKQPYYSKILEAIAIAELGK